MQTNLTQRTLQRKVDGMTNDDAPLDPRAMLDIIETEKREHDRAMTRPIPLFYLGWGVAWFAGYLLLWAANPGSGSPIVVPPAVAWIAFSALMVTAVVVSTVTGIRMNRGIRGTSQWVGAVYGWSWTILGIAVAAVGSALLQAGMPPELALIFFPSGYAIIVAALYLAGAMLWRSTDQLVIAIIFAVAGAVSPFFGVPLNLLVMALVGGGSLLTAGVVAIVVNRRL